jgi:hypothetical protein
MIVWSIAEDEMSLSWWWPRPILAAGRRAWLMVLALLAGTT